MMFSQLPGWVQLLAGSGMFITMAVVMAVAKALFEGYTEKRAEAEAKASAKAVSQKKATPAVAGAQGAQLVQDPAEEATPYHVLEEYNLDSSDVLDQSDLVDSYSH